MIRRIIYIHVHVYDYYCSYIIIIIISFSIILMLLCTYPRRWRRTFSARATDTKIARTSVLHPLCCAARRHRRRSTGPTPLRHTRARRRATWRPLKSNGLSPILSAPPSHYPSFRTLHPPPPSRVFLVSTVTQYITISHHIHIYAYKHTHTCMYTLRVNWTLILSELFLKFVEKSNRTKILIKNK